MKKAAPLLALSVALTALAGWVGLRIISDRSAEAETASTLTEPSSVAARDSQEVRGHLAVARQVVEQAAVSAPKANAQAIAASAAAHDATETEIEIDAEAPATHRPAPVPVRRGRRDTAADLEAPDNPGTDDDQAPLLPPSGSLAGPLPDESVLAEMDASGQPAPPAASAPSASRASKARLRAHSRRMENLRRRYLDVENQLAQTFGNDTSGSGR